MAHMLLGLLPPMVIADLGAGEGTLSQLLARTARQVIAVDNSEKMVEFGAALAREHGFANLEYRLGDIQSPPIERKASTWRFSARRCTTRRNRPGRWRRHTRSCDRADGWSSSTYWPTISSRRASFTRTCGWDSANWNCTSCLEGSRLHEH